MALQVLGWSHKVILKLEQGSKRLTVLELIELGEALGFDPPAAVRRVMKKSSTD